MATEADLGEETILLKEKCLNPGELLQPPQTVVHLIKSGIVELASNVDVETVNSSFQGNVGVTAGESFSESPLIAKVPDQETNTKQETCQTKDISYEAEETAPEEKNIEKEARFESTEVKEPKEHEVVDEINAKAAVNDSGHQSSDATGIILKLEKIEEQYLEVVKEETSKEEILVNHVEANHEGSVEEKHMQIEKETAAPQKDEEERMEDNDAESQASKAAATLEASTSLNDQPSVLTSDLTVHNLDINVETREQASLQDEHEDNAGNAETIATGENSTGRISEGVPGEKIDGCSSVLDEDNSPNVAKPIEEKEEEDVTHDSIKEPSPILETSTEFQINNQENSLPVEDAKDKLDTPSVTLKETDRPSKQEEASNVASTEESQDATNLSDETNAIISSVDQTQETNHAKISSDTKTNELSVQEVDKTEISHTVTETLPENYVKQSPQETMTEAIGIKSEADSSGGEKHIDEAITDGQIDSLVQHEDGEKNIDEEMTISDASALDNRYEDRDNIEAGEENISQAVTAQQINQEESGQEKNLPPTELDQKSETAETEFDNKNSGETHLLEQETILAESKELGQDSNLEPHSQLQEASEDRYSIKQNENDSQACESTENIADRVVTTGQNATTSENDIENSEKLHGLGSQDQPEVKDGEMSIKEDKHETEEACVVEKPKSVITGDNNKKCHTDESSLETISSIEKNFQEGSINESATALKDEEVEKTNNTNDQITSIEKVTDEEAIHVNATNLSSDVVNEETVESFQEIDKEGDAFIVEDTKEQIIEGTHNANLSTEAVEDAPLENFENDENGADNSSSREMLEHETAGTFDSIRIEGKGSDDIHDLTLQNSWVKEQETLQSGNLITSEGSLAEISMENDKIIYTNLPEEEKGEHKETLKGVKYLEQTVEKNEDKEHTEHPVNVLSAEIESVLSQSDAITIQESVKHPQEDGSEAETEKDGNSTNETYNGNNLQETVDEDPVVVQRNESCIDKPSAEITQESTAATCKNIASETIQNAECPIETIPKLLVDTTTSNECLETISCAKEDTTTEHQEEISDKKNIQELSTNVDDIRDEILKEENLLSRELNENIETTVDETLDKKENGLNELAEVTTFETKKTLHETNGGGDELKNVETDSEACKGTENTDSEHLSAKEAENTEIREAEMENLEKVHEPESKEEMEKKDAQMSIEANTGNIDESSKEDIQNLESSDTDRYNVEEVEQNFQVEETSTSSEGEENGGQTISVIDKEMSYGPKITGVDEVNDKESIVENFTQLSPEVTGKEIAESSEHEEDKTTGENIEEKIILQKSPEEETTNIFQSYEKSSDNPSSRQKFEESETDETVTSITDEAKHTDTSPNQTPQSSIVAGHGTLQSENQTVNIGSFAEEIAVEGSSIKDKEDFNELAERGEHSKESMEEDEDAEKQHEISLENEAETSSQIDNIKVEETALSPQANEERDEGRKNDVLLKGEADEGQTLQNDNTRIATTEEALRKTDNCTEIEITEIPQENEERDAGREKEDGTHESTSKSLQQESVVRNSTNDCENDDRVEKLNKEIFGEHEAAERGEKIIHEANQSNATNSTIPSSLVKEEESLQSEDKGIPEESSLEDKMEEGPIIVLQEDDIKEIDNHTSEPVHFSLEMNQNEESLNSSLQTSAEDVKHTLEEEPQEKGELSLNKAEETTVRPQDGEEDAETAQQGDIVNENLPLEHVAQDLITNSNSDGDSTEKSDTEILEEPKAVESVENITYETDQNDSPNAINPTAPVEDVESLDYEEKDVAVESSEEDKKEEVKKGEDNDSIILNKENNTEGGQETSKTSDEMTPNEESLDSSTQASEVREEETPGNDNPSLEEASTKTDEDRENYTGLRDAGEHNKELLEKEDAEDILQDVALDPVKNFKNDGIGAGNPNEKSLEQPKGKEGVENTTHETNPHDSGNATDPVAPEEEEESLHCEEKNMAKEASTDKKKEEPSSINASEDSNGRITMIEENDKEGGLVTSKTDDYSSHEMTNNEESLNSSIQTSLGREEEAPLNDNLTPIEAPNKKDEDNESCPGLIEVKELKELQEKEEDGETILQKDEPKEHIKEPSNVISIETKAEVLTENKETVESPKDNVRIDAETEKEEVIDESSTGSLLLASVAQNPENEVRNVRGSILEEVQNVQNDERTVEEETTENEDSDGSKVTDVSASEDIKVTVETHYANEVVEEKLVTSETDSEITKAYVSDYSEKLDGEDIRETKEEEINEDNVIKFKGGNTACIHEDTEKHIPMEEHLSRDISLQPGGEETNPIPGNEAQAYRDVELTQGTTQQVPKEVHITGDQCTESESVTADDMAVMVSKTEMHEIIQAAVQNSYTGKQITPEGKEIEDILEVPAGGIQAEGHETVDHFNKDGDDIKEVQRRSIGGEIIHEVKESSLVSSEYLATKDSNEHTETGSLEVQEAQDSKEESAVKKEDFEVTKEEVIKEQIIENTESSSDKIKKAITLEATSEPKLEEVQIDEMPVRMPDIPLDASSLHAAETGAGQQDGMALEEIPSNLPSQLPTDEQEDAALENAGVGDTEENRETYETKSQDIRELHALEVREGIIEVDETVLRSQGKETVTETEVAIDQNSPEEILKEPEVQSLTMACSKDDCQTKPIIGNIEEHSENIEMTKDKSQENSSLKTVEDGSLQIESPQMFDVSQLDLQVKGMPDSPTEECREKRETISDNKEESEEGSRIESQTKCHSLEGTALDEVAHDQSLQGEKSEEQHQTELCVLLSEELEFGSSTEIKNIEETMKEEKFLEVGQRKSEEACLPKEDSGELQASEPDFEPQKDTEESSNESQKEESVTSVETEDKKEVCVSELDSNSKGQEAAKAEKEEDTPVPTNYADKSQEENLMPSYPLLSMEQEGETSTIIGSTEEKTKDIQILEDEPNTIQDDCLQKEEARDLKVPSYEFQPQKDEQESLKEIKDKEDGARDGLKEETEEVSELVLKSGSQDYPAVPEDKNTSHQPQPTETSKEEEPENAPKTIEELSLQKEDPRDFKPSELELQMGDDIQNESQKEVQDAKDVTAEESLKLLSQHEIEKKDAEKVDLAALVNQSEKTTIATEVVHTEVANEQIMEEKSDARSSHAIIGDATKESFVDNQLVIEENLEAKIPEEIENKEIHEEFAKADQSETTKKQISAAKGPVEPFLWNETADNLLSETRGTIIQAGRELTNENQYDEATARDSSVNSVEKELRVEKSGKVGTAVEAIEINQNIHQQERTSTGILKDQKESETMASTVKKEVQELQQEPNVETAIITEDRHLQPEGNGVEHSMDDENVKAMEETVSKDSATISLQDMLQRSRIESEAAKEPTASKEEIEAEKQTLTTDKAKSDEEAVEEEDEDDEDEGEETKRTDSGSDAPVMVESSRDIEIKIAQKKSHNILSGVGSKVKHSIIKVKKAITGKSSQTKQHSPK